MLPRAIYHHCEGYRYCPPPLPRDRITTREVVPESEAPKADPALQGRLRESEQRLMVRRAPKRPPTAPSGRADPPRLQLLVAKLSGAQGHRSMHADQYDAYQELLHADHEQEPMCDKDTTTLLQLQDLVDDGAAAALTQRRSCGPAAEVFEQTVGNCSIVSPVGGERRRSTTSTVVRRSSICGHNGHPAAPSKVEVAVQSMVDGSHQRLKELLVHARSDTRRQHLQDELDRMGRIEGHCHSAVASADLTSRRGREQFQQSLDVDHMSQEELEGRLMYGSYLKRLVLAEQRAAHRALEQCITSKKHNSQLQSAHADRALQVQHKRREEVFASRAENLCTLEEWKRRAAERHTLSYHDRVARAAQQEISRCATMWASVVLLFSFPRRVIAQRAAAVERLLLSRKRKGEHVAHFVGIMRDVLARRRRRVARQKGLVLRCCFRWLVLFWSQRRRRNAVAEIVAWFHEYSRNKPATDMIAKFKRAIVRCQRIARQWIHRRRLEECWTLLKLQQLSGPRGWKPSRPVVLVKRSLSADVKADAKRDVEQLVNRFVAEVIPPLSIRLDAVWSALRKDRQAYTTVLLDYLKEARMEKRRRAHFVRKGCDASMQMSLKVLVRPVHRLFPCEETLQALHSTIMTDYAVWLRQKIDCAMKEHQQRSASPEGVIDGQARRWVPAPSMISAWVRDADEVPLIRIGLPFLVAPSGGDHKSLDTSLARSLRLSQSRDSTRSTSMAASRRPNKRNTETTRPSLCDAAALYRQALLEL